MIFNNLWRSGRRQMFYDVAESYAVFCVIEMNKNFHLLFNVDSLPSNYHKNWHKMLHATTIINGKIRKFAGKSMPEFQTLITREHFVTLRKYSIKFNFKRHTSTFSMRNFSCAQNIKSLWTNWTGNFHFFPFSDWVGIIFRRWTHLKNP